jgi:hypothetical protein
MSIISQLRPGADLSRITLPTFILEPKSMLERITKYACRSGAVLMGFDGDGEQLHATPRNTAADTDDR